jgi:eukaryotic-like serine/threonine-protein kinase
MKQKMVKSNCLILFLTTILLFQGGSEAYSKSLIEISMAEPHTSCDLIIFLPITFQSVNIKGGYDPVEMIHIQSGEFYMGCHPDYNDGAACWEDQLPLRSIYLDDYLIDKYEVTNGQYARCVEKGYCPAPIDFSSYSRYSYYDNYVFANYPVVWVNWANAHDYCAWAGKRLPTEAEWEKAARGPSLQAYPWGDEPPDCTRANYRGLDGCVGDTMEVGSYPSGASPYGVMDMAGNVREWVNDWYGSMYYSYMPERNPPGPENGCGKVIRGTSLFDTAVQLVFRFNRDPLVYSNGTGFRCAVSP